MFDSVGAERMTAALYSAILFLLLLHLHRTNYVRGATEEVDVDDSDGIGNELYEIRVYESAPPGTKATPNEAFERLLRAQKNCFAQLDVASAEALDWVEFDSALLMFITTADVPTTVRPTQQAVLHLMCSSNRMRTIHFSVHVTRRNRHPPRFSADAYRFHVPAALRVGAELARLVVTDQDPIIYNSQVQLSLLPERPVLGSAHGHHHGFHRPEGGSEPALDAGGHWQVLRNGTLVVRKPLSDLQLYRPYTVRVLAVDFGSPQLFSIANVTIIPVSVSQVRNVRVNVASTEYQVFEWDAPAFGIAERYRLAFERRGRLLHTQDVERHATIALSRAHLPVAPDYTVTITAVDVDGETPSEPHTFMLVKSELTCEGKCSPRGGGVPLCYYGKFHRIEQYRDADGTPHCLCYDGYSSPQCDVVESCVAERRIDTYGGVDWPSTAVNRSAAVPCPYNADGERIERRCAWDGRLNVARWRNATNEAACKTQERAVVLRLKPSSILVHLGVLANYAQRADQTASGLRAVQRFLAAVLRMPAFDPHIQSAHFDAKIAEHVAQVVDAIAVAAPPSLHGARNESGGGASNNNNALADDVGVTLAAYISDLARRMPVPFNLHSADGGLQIKTWHWVGGESDWKRENNNNNNNNNAIYAYRQRVAHHEQQQSPTGVNEMPREFPTQFGRRCYIHLPAATAGMRTRRRPAAADAPWTQVVRVACLRATAILPLLDGRSPLLFAVIDDAPPTTSSSDGEPLVSAEMTDGEASVKSAKRRRHFTDANRNLGVEEHDNAFHELIAAGKNNKLNNNNNNNKGDNDKWRWSGERRSLPDDLRVLVALRPEREGASAVLAESGGGGGRRQYSAARVPPQAIASPPINYTCAIYDHSKYGWSITGITVLSRNFENGFVLCETTQLGIFALLPESLFADAASALEWRPLRIFVAALPIASAVLAILCTVFLLLIAVFQRPRCTDPALLAFLLTFLLVHTVHLIALVAPHLAAYRHHHYHSLHGDTVVVSARPPPLTPSTLPAPTDGGDGGAKWWSRALYLTLQYGALAVAALIALLNASTHARVANVDVGRRRVIACASRVIITAALGVAVPLLLCTLTWLFDGFVYRFPTADGAAVPPTPVLRPLNAAFVCCFAAPLVLAVGGAIGYAAYTYHYAHALLRHHTTRVASAASSELSVDRQRLTDGNANNGGGCGVLSPSARLIAESARRQLLRDLANAAVFSVLVLAFYGAATILFYQRVVALGSCGAVIVGRSAALKRNILLAVFHVAGSFAVFVFAGLLYRVELKYPRYATRANHVVGGGADYRHHQRQNGGGNGTIHSASAATVSTDGTLHGRHDNGGKKNGLLYAVDEADGYAAADSFRGGGGGRYLPGKSVDAAAIAEISHRLLMVNDGGTSTTVAYGQFERNANLSPLWLNRAAGAQNCRVESRKEQKVANDDAIPATRWPSAASSPLPGAVWRRRASQPSVFAAEDANPRGGLASSRDSYCRHILTPVGLAPTSSPSALDSDALMSAPASIRRASLRINFLSALGGSSTPSVGDGPLCSSTPCQAVKRSEMPTQTLSPTRHHQRTDSLGRFNATSALRKAPLEDLDELTTTTDEEEEEETRLSRPVNDADADEDDSGYYNQNHRRDGGRGSSSGGASSDAALTDADMSSPSAQQQQSPEQQQRVMDGVRTGQEGDNNNQNFNNGTVTEVPSSLHSPTVVSVV